MTLNYHLVTMGMPFVFIILPVFNGEKYILQQLMSIYYQGFKNWYLVIVNDGSTDNTIEIIENFIKSFHLEDKVITLSKCNEGTNKAIESGLYEIQKVKSKLKGYDFYISYCDSDDIWMRNKLEFELNYIEKNKGDLCYHDLIVIDENDNIISNSWNTKFIWTPLNNIFDNSFEKFCLSNHVTSTCMLFKYNFIEKIVPIIKGQYQDRYTCLLISGLKGKILYLNKPLALYRRHSGQLSTKKITSQKFLNEFISYLKSIKGRLPDENKKFADYMINYYQTGVEYLGRNRIFQLLHIIKHPKIFKKYLKGIISYFLKIH